MAWRLGCGKVNGPGLFVTRLFGDTHTVNKSTKARFARAAASRDKAV